MRKAQSGFTLIELVIVIVILGILAATALPRFIDITDDAHVAAVQGAGGGLASGVSLGHALYLARGASGATTLDMEGHPVDFNASGWPLGSSTTECQNTWEGVMQNPPAVSGADADYSVASASPCEFTYQPDTNLGITYDPSDGSVAIDDDITS